MTRPPLFSYTPGPRRLGSLPADQDLLSAVEAVCRCEGIACAAFRVSGTVRSLTVGSYDPAQQVWVTAHFPDAQEIVVCTGTVMGQAEGLKACAQIVAADTRGHLHGGRLFSETVILEAEIDIESLDGPALKRVYDAESGRWRLSMERDADPEPNEPDA